MRHSVLFVVAALLLPGVACAQEAKNKFTDTFNDQRSTLHKVPAYLLEGPEVRLFEDERGWMSRSEVNISLAVRSKDGNKKFGSSLTVWEGDYDPSHPASLPPVLIIHRLKQEGESHTLKLPGMKEMKGGIRLTVIKPW
jgi:hypothetical protein